MIFSQMIRNIGIQHTYVSCVKLTGKYRTNMTKTFFLLCLSLIVEKSISLPTSTHAPTSPSPDADCVAECDLDKVECGVECRDEMFPTRQGFLNCSLNCKTEFTECLQECLSDAIDQVQKAKQEALADVEDVPQTETVTTTTAKTSGTGSRNKAVAKQSKDLIHDKFSSIGSESTGILSSALVGDSNQDGVVISSTFKVDKSKGERTEKLNETLNSKKKSAVDYILDDLYAWADEYEDDSSDMEKYSSEEADD